MILGENRGLNTFTLKILAVLFMLLDHIYLYFFSPSVGAPLILTCIGRGCVSVVPVLHGLGLSLYEKSKNLSATALPV